MIVQCSNCQTKLQLDETKLYGNEVTVQCPKCQQKNKIQLNPNLKTQGVYKTAEATVHCRHCNNQVNAQAVICPQCGCKPMTGNQYCNNCGSPTNPNAVVCTNCGISFKSSSLNISDLRSNENFNRAVKSPMFWCAVTIIISFFLPWFDLILTSITGWELKDLVRFMKATPHGFKASGLVNLMYALPVSALVLCISFFANIDYINKWLKQWKILAGGLPFAFLLLLLFNGANFDYISYGFYFTIIAAAYLLYDTFILDRKKGQWQTEQNVIQQATIFPVKVAQQQHSPVSSNNKPEYELEEKPPVEVTEKEEAPEKSSEKKG